METEVKMFMLTSGVPVITYETRNGDQTLWEYAMKVFFIPPQRPGLDPTIHFELMNHNMLCKTQKSFPNMEHVLYMMPPTDKLQDMYQSVVEDMKMKMAGLVTASSSKLITAP